MALASENIFQSKTVGVADVKFCVGHRGACGQMDAIWCGLKLMGKCVDIIHCFSSSDSPLGDVVHAIFTLTDILFMLIRKIEVYGFLFLNLCHKYHSRFRPYLLFLHYFQ